jgi:DNA-directed RNA polymerase
LNLSIISKDKLNTNKQKRALMPNLVHSLDAASLCLVIESYFKENNNINFYSIHDCFAVPCNKVSLLTELLKSAYCIIYSDSKYLVQFNENFLSKIKSYYGENAVSLIDNNLTVTTKSGVITLKYPDINFILDSKISKIDVRNSSYIIS